MLLCVRFFGRPFDRSSWEDALDAFDALTPLVDDAREGVAFLDMRGVPGSLPLWSARVQIELARFARPLRVAAGPNRFCAYAATWLGDEAVIEAGEEAARVAPLPLDALALDSNVRQRLELLGITTLGELARLPHGPFVRRFGREAARWHEAARGIDRTPFVPRAQSVAIEASMFGEGGAAAEEAVFFALRALLARIGSDLDRCGKRANSLQIEVELEDAIIAGFDVPLASATADECIMFEIVRAKFSGMTFNAPLVGLRVRAAGLEEGGEALPLLRGDDIDRHNVALTLARLEAQLGEPVRQAHTRAAHPLEERFRYGTFALPKREPLDGAPAMQPRIVPQLRLLTVTEIEVRVLRGEPAFVGSRAVVQSSGPWRIEEGWFISPIARDEYDVVLSDGAIYRIYRQGAHWYLRGSYD